MIERDNQFKEEMTLHCQKKDLLVPSLIAMTKYPDKGNFINKGVMVAHEKTVHHDWEGVMLGM